MSHFAIPGYLPYFLLVTGAVGIAHTITTYIRPGPALTQFSGPAAPPRNALTAHVYGVKNFYTCLIRVYTAFYVTNAQLYDLTVWTFVGVLGLYLSEWLVFRTVRPKEAVYPLVMSVSALTWMLRQRGWYTA